MKNTASTLPSNLWLKAATFAPSGNKWPGLLVILAVCAGSSVAGPIQWPANGHYYETVFRASDWDTARAAAQGRTYLGAHGHLATITSAAESVFVTNTFGAGTLNGLFLGGRQAPGAPEPAGGWGWITGEPWSFTNWGGSEPNNFGGNENVLEFAHAPTVFGKGWNDLPAGAVRPGYLVEYEGAVPEPSALWLTMPALCALFIARRPRA